VSSADGLVGREAELATAAPAGRPGADIFEGPPEFTDLTVVEEWTDAG
jgi:hypothetical protein